MQIIKQINDSVNSVLWGVPMLILMIGTGVFFTCRLGFFQLVHFPHIFSQTVLKVFKKDGARKTKDKKSISQFQAMSTALAATIGTGNIAGVASALTVGGAGAVFWMWVSAFFGMMTSFAENVLGVYYRKRNENGEWTGGAMYYIGEGLKNCRKISAFAKPLSVMFAVFCTLASFGIGNISQVNSMAVSLESTFGVPPLAVGIATCLLVLAVLIGGVKRIGAVAEKIVPFMALFYIVITSAVLIKNSAEIPNVFSSIFKGAFGLDAVAGGISGAAIKKTLTMGLKRGVFSNEAGMGSGVIVNSSSDVKEPVVQGMWGIFEVFFDTIVMCTLTAFAVLSSGVLGTLDQNGNLLDSSALVSASLGAVFGNFAGALVSISTALFAFATVLGWSYYGEKSLEYLFGRRCAVIYKIVFALACVAGATMKLSLAWEISDTLNALMAVPNLIGILLLSKTVKRITKNYKERFFKGKKTAPMLSYYPEIEFFMTE